LFGHDIETGITLTRDFTTAPNPPSDSADFFVFRVLQPGEYVFTLNGANFPVSDSPALVDAQGNVVVPGQEGVLRVDLTPGTYRLRIDGWDPNAAGNAVYRLVISIGASSEHPTPLTTGAAPALRLRLPTTPPVSPPPPVLSFPTPSSGGITPT